MTTAAPFDPALEPLRAIRDLINMAEGYRLVDVSGEDDRILERAQAGFTALRELFGDNRPAEDLNDTEAMAIEPPQAHSVHGTILRLLAMPLDADCQVDVAVDPGGDNEFRNFTVAHTTSGTPADQPQMVALVVE